MAVAAIFLCQPASPAGAAISSDYVYNISNAAGGGDCTLIGYWDPVTLTCTLGSDISFGSGTDGIYIDSDGITLDGNGYALTGDPTRDTHGVYLSGRTGVTVKNLHISQFRYGIYLYDSDSNTLTNNNASSNDWDGIALNGAANNTISGNVCSGSASYDGLSLSLHGQHD